MDLEAVVGRYRVTDGAGFRLTDHDPGDTAGLDLDKKQARGAAAARACSASAELQDMLYAQDRWAVLLIFQAMDAAGKDSTIKHVMSGVNPQGVQVHAFKQPSAEELDHDFLWRAAAALPERGRIGVFNRSYYEEVLVVRVHETILRRPEAAARAGDPDGSGEQRHEDIAAFERYLARNGTLILKFFLNVSREGAEEALPGPPRRAREALEVLALRRGRARALGRLHGGLRGRDPRHRGAARALVRHPGRPQVVHAPRRGRRDRRGAARARPRTTRRCRRSRRQRSRRRDGCWRAE